MIERHAVSDNRFDILCCYRGRTLEFIYNSERRELEMWETAKSGKAKVLREVIYRASDPPELHKE